MRPSPSLLTTIRPTGKGEYRHDQLFLEFEIKRRHPGTKDYTVLRDWFPAFLEEKQHYEHIQLLVEKLTDRVVIESVNTDGIPGPIGLVERYDSYTELVHVNYGTSRGRIPITELSLTENGRIVHDREGIDQDQYPFILFLLGSVFVTILISILINHFFRL